MADPGRRRQRGARPLRRRRDDRVGLYSRRPSTLALEWWRRIRGGRFFWGAKL